MIGITARRNLLLAFIGLVQVLMVWHIFHDHPVMQARVVGWVMVFSFLSGLLFYRFRYRVPFSAPLAIAAAVTTELLMNVRGGDYVAALPVAYLTCYLGLLNPRKALVVRSGDYSYGLYLYGFPIQQAVWAATPLTHAPIVNFLVSYPLAFLMAIFSWHVVEKPATKLKKYVMTCEGWALRIPPINWHSRRVFTAPLRS